MEELGVTLINLKYLGAMENIFTMDGEITTRLIYLPGRYKRKRGLR
jgi:hypothetical protein